MRVNTSFGTFVLMIFCLNICTNNFLLKALYLYFSAVIEKKKCALGLTYVKLNQKYNYKTQHCLPFKHEINSL